MPPPIAVQPDPFTRPLNPRPPRSLFGPTGQVVGRVGERVLELEGLGHQYTDLRVCPVVGGQVL